MKRYLSFFLFSFVVIFAMIRLSACAVMGSSPEAQITQGAQAHTAASSLAANLLERNKITLDQAKNYRAMLGTASAALDGSAATLRACRTANAGAPGAVPDPCAVTVTTDVNLALAVLSQIETALKAQAAK
jgi:hypothetical protein